jgi:hypothetical protein
MSTSFATLLRSSRLATYDRSIAQVYTAPKQFKKEGSFGLKRNLPKVIRTKYVTISQLDTSQHQTVWQPANSQVLFLKRWAENFPNSKKCTPRSDIESHNIIKMTPANFERFLTDCSKKAAPAFQQSLKKKEIVPEQVFEYLNVTFAENPSESPVGPTYSEYTVPENTALAVEGRILNAERHGHAVGIGGVVAFLPKRHSMGLRQLGDRRVRTFYVESAHIDDEGKPRVVLTLTPPGTANLPFMLAFEEDIEERKQDTMSFLTRKQSLGRVKDDDIKVVANPDHDKLMSRIAGLISKNKN